MHNRRHSLGWRAIAGLLVIGGCATSKPAPIKPNSASPTPQRPTTTAKDTPSGLASPVSPAPALQAEERNTSPVPSDESSTSTPQNAIEKDLEIVDRVPQGSWQVLSRFSALADGESVEQDSRKWAGRLFRRAASPYAATQVQRSVHHATDDTLDLLRHIYRTRVGERTLDLEVIESAQFVLIRVRPTPGLALGAATAGAITRLADAVLVMKGTAIGPTGNDKPYRWSFQYPPSIGEGARFSNAPNAHPVMLNHFTDRVDGGIQRGTLFLLAHKIHDTSSGRRIFLDGQHWFDGKCWDEYR